VKLGRIYDTVKGKLPVLLLLVQSRYESIVRYLLDSKFDAALNLKPEFVRKV